MHYFSENADTVERKKKIILAHKYVQTGSGLKIDAADLTSEGKYQLVLFVFDLIVFEILAGPSDNYWEIIAERRRIALDESLEENRRLHEENESLKEENRLCKDMLEESKSLVEVLTVCEFTLNIKLKTNFMF